MIEKSLSTLIAELEGPVGPVRRRIAELLDKEERQQAEIERLRAALETIQHKPEYTHTTNDEFGRGYSAALKHVADIARRALDTGGE